MTPNIFSLYVCLRLTSLFLRSHHHQNDTINLITMAFISPLSLNQTG